MSTRYLCYDVKGIQQFIFSVPKLKYMVGGSATIHAFDYDVVPRLTESCNAHILFSGGGRGTIACGDDADAGALRGGLVKAAHERGLDLRLGQSEDPIEAMHSADELYPFCPDDLEGQPCAVSGLWPVAPGAPEGIHPVILARRERAGVDDLGCFVMDRLREGDMLPDDLGDGVFMKSVRPDPADDPETRRMGRAADAALGGRNRWAVVAMDGNDVGAQFREGLGSEGRRREEPTEWLKAASQCMRQSTVEAFVEAVARVISDWWESSGRDAGEKIKVQISDGGEHVVLPFRPLILGGDDLLCICHCSHAMDLAVGMARAFAAKSLEVAKPVAEHWDGQLWPLNDGRLTMSAGIAYAAVGFPLHTVIPYAESLLASAKWRGRRARQEGGETPAAVDWENLTENMVDTPAARRQRELLFVDPEIGDAEVCLTCRPYTLDELEKLRGKVGHLGRGGGLPRSWWSELAASLRRPWSERVAWWWSGLKHGNARKFAEIFDMDESDPDRPGSGWVVEGKKRSTQALDAMLLLEESRRMDQETTENGEGGD